MLADANATVNNDIVEDGQNQEILTDRQFTFWRSRGPYGRLRNIITYICWSPQRRESFLQLCQEQQPNLEAFLPISANATRWHGDFLAIKRAIELRVPLESFIVRLRATDLKDDQLEPEI